MSVCNTSTKVSKPRFSARYKPFRAPAAGDAQAVAQAHLEWLLGNVDWHALRGRGRSLRKIRRAAQQRSIANCGSSLPAG